ncbi:hypothetical protein FACS189485_19810 [Spirochaetia bacterium]|nr:hypothetical protein FACS189485_19810 [Spirochaetia bacterium]
MISVAINDIPQLSQYVSRVHDGERVVITEGDTVVAELSVPEPDVPKDGDDSSFWKNMKRLSRKGEATLAKNRNGPFPMPNFEGLEGIDYMTILDEVRADRFGTMPHTGCDTYCHRTGSTKNDR